MLLTKSTFTNFFYKNRVQILWVVATILVFYFILFSVKKINEPTYGFASYYTASRLLIEGENVAEFYNDDWFRLKVEKYVPGVDEIYLVNLPTTAFILLPVAGLNYQTARVIWIIFNLIFFAVIICFIISKLKLNHFSLSLLLIMFLVFQPLYANIAFGQVYILITCLLILAWFANESGNEKVLGVIVSLIFILKTAGALLFLLFLIQKKWKALFWSLATMVLLLTITLPFVGFNSWLAFIDETSSYLFSPTLSVTAYQSIHSLFHHLLSFDEQWNPEPIANFPLLATILTIILSVTLLTFTLMYVYKYKRPDLAFGALIIVGIILNPASIDYHYLMIMIPVLILYKNFLKNSSTTWWILFSISFLLIAANIPYVSTKVTKGILAVFAYPKLYGALGLWFINLRMLKMNGVVR